jgi:FkbM family methyltransferase
MNMINSTKFLIQRQFRKFGWEIHRFVETEMAQVAGQLRRRRIDVVLDIGANEGQFASALLSTGYTGSIVSFEPLPDPYRKLSRQAKWHDRWEVAPRSAVGATTGAIEINIAGNSVSSSILPILEGHTSAAPMSKYVGKEMVPMITLDSFKSHTLLNRPFIKIDTQGYEMEVLRGAEELLTDATGVQVEVSIAPLYTGQPDCFELLNFIRGAGFELWTITPGFREPQSGRLLQMDAVFFRT